jgi:hypothetical protein
MTAITKKEVTSYVRARYTSARWAHDGWVTISSEGFLPYRQAMDEALAEKESYEDGISKKPAWLA